MDHPSPDSPNPYASPGLSTEGVPASSSPNTPTAPLLQPIHISGDLPLEEFIIAMRVIRRATPLKYILPISFIFNALIFLFVFYNLFQAGGTLGYAFPLLIGGILILGPLASLLIVPKFAYKKAWQNGKNAYWNTNQFIFEDCFESISEKEASRTQWSAFGKYSVTDRLAIVFFENQRYRYHIFSRSCFQSKHDWQCFLGLLDRKMPRG